MRPSASRGWERLFWSVFEESVNPMAMLTERRRIAEVNPAFERLLGYPRDELLGRPVADLLPEWAHPVLESEWQEFLASGELAGERELVRRDGVTIHFEYAAHTEQVTGRRLALFVALHAEVVDPGEEQSTGALSPREREIVELIARGRNGEEIAEQLGVSPATVRTHVARAKTKLGARNRAQLVAKALGHGLIHEAPVE